MKRHLTTPHVITKPCGGHPFRGAGIVLVLALALGLPIVLPAQSTANFSGTWIAFALAPI